MKAKFVKYSSKCSLALAVAAILDPQFKLKLVEYYYSQIYGSTALDRIKEVSDGLKELFDTQQCYWKSISAVVFPADFRSAAGIADQKLTSQAHEIVGRINGRFGTLTAVAMRHLDCSLDLHALCALYAVTDVALVTSLRDGMYLVSYEYVACQDSKRGVLILSEGGLNQEGGLDVFNFLHGVSTTNGEEATTGALVAEVDDLMDNGWGAVSSGETETGNDLVGQQKKSSEIFDQCPWGQKIPPETESQPASLPGWIHLVEMVILVKDITNGDRTRKVI
ncbi:hypothetical protein ACFX1S_031209 [Malus domestica]